MSEFVRTFTPDLEVRSAAQGGDGRTVVGIAVPFEKPQRIDARLVEQFARGAFDHQLRAAHRIPYAFEHMKLGGRLVGRVLEMRNDAAGLWSALRVSATEAGDELLEFIRDGVVPHLSVAFRERQNRRLAGGITERVTADLREIASTLEGAYGDAAAVSGVRSLDGSEAPRRAEVEQILAGLPVLSV